MKKYKLMYIISLRLNEITIFVIPSLKGLQLPTIDLDKM